MNFWNFRDNLKSLNTKKLQEIAIKAADEKYINYLIDEQLDDGQRPNGDLFDKYSDVTIEIKKKTGGFLSRSGRISLKDKGDFREKKTVKKLKTQINISSKDSKAKEIFEEFGDVFGLTADNFDLMIEDSEDERIELTQKELFK